MAQLLPVSPHWEFGISRRQLKLTYTLQGTSKRLENTVGRVGSKNCYERGLKPQSARVSPHTAFLMVLHPWWRPTGLIQA